MVCLPNMSQLFLETPEAAVPVSLLSHLDSASEKPLSQPPAVGGARGSAGHRPQRGGVSREWL